MQKADRLLNLYEGLSGAEILKIEELKLRALSSLLTAQASSQTKHENEQRVRPSNIQGNILSLNSKYNI